MIHRKPNLSAEMNIALDDYDKARAELDALIAKGKTQCPFDGNHFSSMGKAVCPWCNPNAH